MSDNPIIGIPVGTPTSPKKMDDLLKPVKTVNGKKPDENGDVEVVALPKVSETDNGKIMQVVDGEWKVASLAVYNGEHEVIE